MHMSLVIRYSLFQCHLFVIAVKYTFRGLGENDEEEEEDPPPHRLE